MPSDIAVMGKSLSKFPALLLILFSDKSKEKQIGVCMSHSDGYEMKEKKQPKLGSGKRFKSLANKMAREGVNDPVAVAASIGIKKYGENKMHKMAMAGKKRREK